MRGFHFSLRWLLGLVSFVAIGCGVLFYANPFLSKLTFTATMVILLAAIPAAVYHAEKRRAFWAGFAMFGFAYLWLTCGTWQSPDGSTPLRERLVTSDLLVRCHEILPSRPTNATKTTSPVVTGPVTFTGSTVYDSTGNTIATGITPATSWQTVSTFMTGTVIKASVDQTDFATTGHAIFALVFAMLGGVIVRRTCRHARVAQTTQSP